MLYNIHPERKGEILRKILIIKTIRLFLRLEN